MKILCDECTPVKLLTHLKGKYSVDHVTRSPFAGMKNGNLLKSAAAAGYDALLTTDKAMPHEQNLSALPVAIILLETLHGTVPELLPLLPKLDGILENLMPKSFTVIRKD
jgi:hypothetical protein